MMSLGKSVLMWAWWLGCSAAQGSDLLDAYRQAVGHDALYAAAQAQQQVGEEYRLQARAGLLPQISLDAQTSWSETRYELATGAVKQRRQNRSYGIQLVQPLFRWQNWIQYKQGNLYEALALLRLHSAEQDLILRVAEAYFEVLNTHDVLESVHELSLVGAEQLARARKGFELGSASKADVDEALAVFDKATAQVIRARSELELARHGLARLTGSWPETIKGLADKIILALPDPWPVEDWVKAAKRNSLEVQEREMLLEVATHELRRRKAEHLPTLDLVINQNMQQSPNAVTHSNEAANIGVRLTAPLYSGGRLSSSAREAQALRLQAEYELQDMQRSAALSARQAWLGVLDGIAQVEALTTALLSAQSAVESNRLGYRLGVRTGIDVLEMQSQLSDTQQQLSRARHETVLALLQLRAAVGALEHQHLADINTLLDDSNILALDDIKTQHLPSNSYEPERLQDLSIHNF